MSTNSASIFSNGHASGHSPSFSDLLFQNERAMWWAEFDSVGEEAVLSNVEAHSYTPTGMEAARQWLERRGIPRSREDAQPVGALAEQVQGTAWDSPGSASEELASQVEANTRAIVEIAVSARRSARAMIFIGAVASILSLCAMAMVLMSSRHAGSNTKQASAQSSRPKQAVAPTPRPAIPPAEVSQAAAIPPENAQKKQPSNAPQIKRQAGPNTKQAAQPSRPKQTVARKLTPAVPPAPIGQAATIAPENAQSSEASDAPPTASFDPKPQGQSLEQVLASIADKVGGTINFTAQFHDMDSGRDFTQQLSYQTGNAAIDPNRCQVKYHWRVEQDGRVVSDQDRAVDLRLARDISVTSIDVENGRRFSLVAYPKVYVLHIARWNSSAGDDLYFRDRETAARVGTATRHAMELCDAEEQQFRPR